MTVLSDEFALNPNTVNFVNLGGDDEHVTSNFCLLMIMLHWRHTIAIEIFSICFVCIQSSRYFKGYQFSMKVQQNYCIGTGICKKKTTEGLAIQLILSVLFASSEDGQL